MVEDERFQEFLAAPLNNDKRFVSFRVGMDKNGSYRLHRSIVDSVPDHLADRVTSFPVYDLDDEFSCEQDPSPLAFPPYLRSLTVINSKCAGGSTGGEVYFNVLSPLLKAFRLRHVYVATDSQQSISNHARSFSSSASVIIIGGDTSVHEFVNFLSPSHDTELRLSVIPAGTGNALMASLGITSPIQIIGRLFLSDDFLPLAAFPVHFPPGSRGINTIDPDRLSYQALVVASWGFHASLVYEADSAEMRQSGADRFGLAASKLITTVDQSYDGRVLDAPTPIGSPISYLLFTTVTNLEADFPISPLCQPPSSCKLYCVAVPKVPNSELMDIMKEVYNSSSHVNDPRVVYEPIHDLCHIQIDDADSTRRAWCVDGSIVEAATGIVTIGKPSTSYNGWKLLIKI